MQDKALFLLKLQKYYKIVIFICDKGRGLFFPFHIYLHTSHLLGSHKLLQKY